MSSTFVPADMIKQMFGCLLNVETEPSYEDRGLPMQPARGTVPVVRRDFCCRTLGGFSS